MPLTIAYFVWAGGSIAGVTLIGAIVFGQSLDSCAYIGIGLIFAGVFVLNALSTAGIGERPKAPRAENFNGGAPCC